MDQQVEKNEQQELRELLLSVLKVQEAILYRLTQLEEQLRKDRE